MIFCKRLIFGLAMHATEQFLRAIFLKGVFGRHSDGYTEVEQTNRKTTMQTDIQCLTQSMFRM